MGDEMGKHSAVTNAQGERVRYWTNDDYLRLSCAMLPLLDKGMKPQDALAIAQRLLPPEKQRPPDRLKRPLYADGYVAGMKQAKAMTPEARAQLVAKMAPETAAELAPPKVKASRPPKLPPPPPREMMTTKNGTRRPASLVMHTPLELALIARRIAYFQIDMKDTRPLSRLFKVAQSIELPPERHRSAHSVDVGVKQIRIKLVRVHSIPGLLDAYPFDRERREYIPTADEPAEAVEHADPRNFVADSLIRHTAQQDGPPQEAAAPVQAPTPAPASRSSLSDPIRAFGDAFAQSMHTLLHAMTHEMMSELELRVGQMSERLMQRTVETISQGIGPLVHAALERELGGKVAAAPVEPELTLPTGAALPKSLQLDVVGLIGHQVTEVKQQLNGYAAGMRFIDADRVDSWTPRQTVIMNTKFVSHNVEGKCRKAGVKPIRVQGGAGAILNAIRTICENEGISLPH
jgi:hypothetical protein